MRISYRHVVVATAAMVLVGWAGPLPTGAASAPTAVSPPAPTLQPSTVAPGGEFTVSGIGCDATQVAVRIVNGPRTTADTVDGGTWQATLTVPADYTPGDYQVVSSCIDKFDYPPVTLSVGMQAPGSISLVKTVGTDPGVCATTSTISVPVGTTVYYCYTVTNETELTLNTHSLSDDKLGPVFVDLAYDLKPLASVNTVAAGVKAATTITADTTNTATWTAQVIAGPPQPAAMVPNTYSATATATVTVTVPSPDAAPASQVVATPAFTG